MKRRTFRGLVILGVALVVAMGGYVLYCWQNYWRRPVVIKTTETIPDEVISFVEVQLKKSGRLQPDEFRWQTGFYLLLYPKYSGPSGIWVSQVSEDRYEVNIDYAISVVERQRGELVWKGP